MEEKNKHIKKAMLPREVAELYGVSVKTLRNWLKPFNFKIKRNYSKYYTIKQVEFIFEKLGDPN